LRQDVAQHDAQMRGAKTACRLDIGEFLEREHDGPNHSPAKRDTGDRDSDDHGSYTRAKRHGNRHCQNQIGKRLEKLNDSLTDDVDASAEVSARQSPERAERGAEQHRADGDGE